MKEFNRLFESVAYRHDYSRVFDDFLSFAIKGFSLCGDFAELNAYGQRTYSEKERLAFGQMIYEWIRVMHREIQGESSWYDALGNYYEVLAGRGKKSALGQFFTPGPVCDLIHALVSEKHVQQLVNEPCCGSGRFVVSFHANNPGNYYLCQDIDPICCKMTALNMCTHGAVGLVLNQDALLMDGPRFAYLVNEQLSYTGCPGIRKVTPEEAVFFYNMWAKKSGCILKKQQVQERQQEALVGHESTAVPENSIKLEKVVQLTLFQ